MTQGIKHDAGKDRYSLLPAGTVRQIVQVLGCDGHPLKNHFRNVTTTNQKGAYEKF